MARRKRSHSQERLTAKPKTSDQAPGEQVVQVNDKYVVNGPPPGDAPQPDEQHKTGG
jgi:hypothetical protein